MGAKGFILMLLLFALVGAGAGYGAAQLVPAEEEEQAPETADLVAPGAGGAEAGAGTGRPRQTGGQPTVDDVIATLSEEQRRDLENNPEGAAMARAQIQMAIDSGAIPPEVLQQLASGGIAGAPDAGTQDAGARNAEPLTGTVVSFESGTLRLETPDGEAAIAVPDDAPVNVTKSVADSGVLPDGRGGGLGGRASGRGGQPGGCRDHRGRRWAGRRRRAWLRWSGGSRDGDRNVVRGRRADVGDGGRRG